MARTRDNLEIVCIDLSYSHNPLIITFHLDSTSFLAIRIFVLIGLDIKDF